MTDMSEGPNVSDERQHAEAVAREWFGANYSAWPELSAHFADLIMAERAGLLARAEAAEAETKRCANGWDAAGREAKGLKLRAEAERSLREQFSDDAYDLRAKLAASEARVAELDGLRPLVAAMGENEADALRAHAERAEAEKTRAVGYLEEMADRALKAEAAAGQMRALIESSLAAKTDIRTCVDLRAGYAALATDAGRDYQSPEQVARACAAARDAAANIVHDNVRALALCGGPEADYAGRVLGEVEGLIRALKAGTP